jgi:hypothetical protein
MGWTHHDDDPRVLGWWCQFCAHRPIAWRYPTRTALSGQPSTLRLCDVCSGDVEEHRLLELHDRVMEHTNIRAASPADTRRVVGSMLAGFLDRRTGPRERIVPA